MDSQKPTEGTPENHTEFQHDQAVALRPAETQATEAVDTPSNEATAPATAAPSPTLPAPVATPAPSPTSQPPQPAVPETATAEDDTQHFASETDNEPEAPTLTNAVPHDPPLVTWRALEFADHPKTLRWYSIFGGVSLAIIIITFIITREVFTTIILVICAGLFGYVAGRHPRELEYGLSGNGIYVGSKFYPYQDFNAFGVFDEGVSSSIDFMPLKRFAPVLSISYDTRQETAILDVLSQHLPFAHHQRTAIDTLMHRIHF